MLKRKIVVGHIVSDLDYKSLSLTTCLEYYLGDRKGNKNEFVRQNEKNRLQKSDRKNKNGR